jgi:hypothetical protein
LERGLKWQIRSWWKTDRVELSCIRHTRCLAAEDDVKHAGADALNALEPLLARLRSIGQLKEKKRGIFYFQNRSFLHFHEDQAGLFADVSAGGKSWRLRVSDPAERDALLETIEAALSSIKGPGPNGP